MKNAAGCEMSKAVMISIHPKWCELIAAGKKTIEIRKRSPKLPLPFKCYIYMTSGDAAIPDGRGMVHHHSGGRCVIGEFVCDKIIPIKVFSNGTIQNYLFYNMEQSCVAYDNIVNYIGNGCIGYGWHISNLVIYDKPKPLSAFGVQRAPQSWCYVEGIDT